MARKKEQKIEIPLDLNPKSNYDFKFNEKAPKELVGKTENVTGELALIFIKKGYGVLC